MSSPDVTRPTAAQAMPDVAPMPQRVQTVPTVHVSSSEEMVTAALAAAARFEAGELP